ncbi:VOC family protein, partial [Streptomyces sp. NPDC004227]
NLHHLHSTASSGSAYINLTLCARGALKRQAQAPHWPDQTVPQQFHLDFEVDDLDEAEALLLALGAAKPEYQPGGDRWRVLTDPAGHPFCLTRREV